MNRTSHAELPVYISTHICMSEHIINYASVVCMYVKYSFVFLTGIICSIRTTTLAIVCVFNILLIDLIVKR